MSDRILIRDLQVFARHGVLPEEERLGQRFALDITAIETFTAKRYALIEAAAEAVAQAALARFPAIERIEVEIRKPAAPIDAVFAFVGVRIERSRGG